MLSVLRRAVGIVAVLVLASSAWGTLVPAVGHDTVDDQFTYGPPVGFVVPGSGSYAGLGSYVSAVDSGESDFLGTSAVIRAGGNPTSGDLNITMGWRNRTSLELNGGKFYLLPPAPPWYTGAWSRPTGGSNGRGVALSDDAHNMASDVVDLQGIQGIYVLEQTYDWEAIRLVVDPGFNEAYLDSKNKITLGWFETNGTGNFPDYDEWCNAVDGNSITGSKAVTFYKGSFDSFVAAHSDFNLTDYLGSFGTDITSHTVWAVLDHDSVFGVIPEPSTLGLLALGALGLLRRR